MMLYGRNDGFDNENELLLSSSQQLCYEAQIEIDQSQKLCQKTKQEILDQKKYEEFTIVCSSLIILMYIYIIIVGEVKQTIPALPLNPIPPEQLKKKLKELELEQENINELLEVPSSIVPEIDISIYYDNLKLYIDTKYYDKLIKYIKNNSTWYDLESFSAEFKVEDISNIIIAPDDEDILRIVNSYLDILAKITYQPQKIKQLEERRLKEEKKQRIKDEQKLKEEEKQRIKDEQKRQLKEQRKLEQKKLKEAAEKEAAEKEAEKNKILTYEMPEKISQKLAQNKYTESYAWPLFNDKQLQIYLTNNTLKQRIINPIIYTLDADKLQKYKFNFLDNNEKLHIFINMIHKIAECYIFGTQDHKNYKYYTENILSQFTKDDEMDSKEHSKTLTFDALNMDLSQYRNGAYKNISSYLNASIINDEKCKLLQNFDLVIAYILEQIDKLYKN